MPESLYLLDGHAQIYRAYYAPFRDLTSPSGEPTRATFVFFSMLFNLIRTRQPTYLVMVIDTEDSSRARRQIYSEYKTNRDPPPEDLLPQIDRILDILVAAGVPIMSHPGYEADDVMATLASRFGTGDLEIYLVSRDKDLEQLITDCVKLYDPTKNEVIDSERLHHTKGYCPGSAIEIQTLTGDNIDNIPGVPGVGLKTAAKLISQYSTAQQVLEHADELTPKLSERLTAYAGQMPVTRQLVTLQDDLPVELDLDSARFTGWPKEVLAPIFEELGFSRLLSALDSSESEAQSPRPATAPPRTANYNDADPEVHYQLVDDEPQLRALIEEVSGVNAFSFDTETTSLNPVQADVVGLSLCWRAGQAYYIPIRAAVGTTLPLETVRQHLQPLFANPQIKKCGHNLKYDLIVLNEMGIEPQGLSFDTMLASFIIDPLRRSHSMDALAEDHFEHQMIPITDLIGKGRNQTTLDQLDTTRVCEYAAEDADYTWRLYEDYQPQIENSTFKELFYDIEIPLVSVLARMERNGVTIDSAFLAAMSTQMQTQVQALEKQIHSAAGRKFNVDSPKQLAEVLFDEQGLRVVRKTKTSRSTDAETLSTLAFETDHPLPPAVLQYRELSKLKSTYVDSLPKMVSKKTGKIHASFNMIGAVTGRLSSNDPNLQNIPIRTEIGRQIRRAFVASDPEHVLLCADYSQIELRLLAHYCQDAALLRAFKEDQDIHQYVAAQVFGVDLKDVSPQQRSRAKAVNFGIIYGQTAFGLARTTAMTREEAQRFIDLYFMRYPGARLFIDSCIQKAKLDGYATTLLGRRRPIPELQSRNRQQQNLGERLAVNTVLQGSAADLIKKAMIDIHQRLAHQDTNTRMIIQVHDELVFEMHRQNADSESDALARQMCQALPLEVPLKVDISWGPNWLEKEYTKSIGS